MRGTLQKSLILVVFLIGCSSSETTTVASSGRVSPTYQGPPEASYCATQQTYADFITVSGTATYIRRELYDNPVASPTFEGLGSASLSHATLPAGEYPIRAAEIRVTDPSGAVIQCGMTNAADGTFSVRLPRGNTDYTFSINSRSGAFSGNGSNVYMNVSVLNRPEANQFYSLKSTVNASANRALGTVTATATSSGELLGGAFNILDQIFAATAYLRANTACGGDGCNAITLTNPVSKVSAYWEKGFNPNDYFGSGNSGLSFYLPGYYRLFILGGVSGDVDSDDTDHFDDSVILHEYGHFLEDAMFTSDSPGGSHNGNKIIDPRLAWSEGWGNFFQAAVQFAPGSTSPRYYDTSGNLDGDPDIFFQTNIETAVAGQDLPSATGEGNFREFSVSRLLWDAIDTNVDAANASTDNRSGEFGVIWTALTKSTSHSFKTTGYAFLNIGHLHLFQQLFGATSWANIATVNYQDRNTSEYAQYVTTAAGPCANYVIDPTVASTSLASSDLFLDNDFYHLKIAAAGTYTIQLRYSDADSAGTEADLDLYLYNEDAVYGSAADVIARSTADPTAGFGVETETVTVSLQPGNYLINIYAYTGGGMNAAGATNYSVRLGGVDLCPASL